MGTVQDQAGQILLCIEGNDMNGQDILYDRKNKFAECFWAGVNNCVLACKFDKISVHGIENIPRSGPFILVSNHVSRWDGLLIKQLVGRPANYMVSPAELRGFQGVVLRSIGAFPASPRFDLSGFVIQKAVQGEATIIFPEGNIYRNGTPYRFKNGAARLALDCCAAGLKCPLIPSAIAYEDTATSVVHLTVGAPLDVEAFVYKSGEQRNMMIRLLTGQLELEVRFLLGSLAVKGKMNQLPLTPEVMSAIDDQCCCQESLQAS